MAGGVTWKVEGLRQLGQNFARLTADMQKTASRAAVREAAKVVAKEAKNHHPMWESQTGALEASIGQRRRRKASGPGIEIWEVGVFSTKTTTYAHNLKNIRSGRAGQSYEENPPTFYWKFLEYGTVKMEPKPFLRPALDNQKEKATTTMVDVLRDKVEGFAAKLPVY